MADLDVTKKLHVYHAVYRLNLSFAAIVNHCRLLEESGVFRNKYLRRYQGYVQELQAEINEELVETLQNVESHDWYRYGKVRKAWEKEIRDPDDVFLEAAYRREELRRQGKKPPRYGRPVLDDEAGAGSAKPKKRSARKKA
jgi:hypothetical protein